MAPLTQCNQTAWCETVKLQLPARHLRSPCDKALHEQHLRLQLPLLAGGGQACSAVLQERKAGGRGFTAPQHVSSVTVVPITWH